MHALELGAAAELAIDASTPMAAAMTNCATARSPRRDPTQLLDIHVHELAGMATLIAIGWLWRLQPRALSQPYPLQLQRGRRNGEAEHLGDLCRRDPQLAQRPG
jgi:hypothetical protein